MLCLEEVLTMPMSRYGVLIAAPAGAGSFKVGDVKGPLTKARLTHIPVVKVRK